MKAIDEVVKRGPMASILACSAALMLLITSESSYWQSARTLDRLDTMVELPSQVQTLQWSLVDAEAARRDPDTAAGAAAYRDAAARIDQALAVLDRHYRQRPQSQPALSALHDRVARILAGHDGAASPAGVRTLGAAMLQGEAMEVVRSRRELDRTLLVGRIGVGAFSAAGLLAWALYRRQAGRRGRLQDASQGLVRAERDRLGVEVFDRTAQLTELTQHLQTAREDERGRLARDLHDELGGLLTSAKLDAARIRARLVDGPPEALERLAHLVEMLNLGIALKRQIIEDLRPSTLVALGLVDTLEILAREFSEQSGIAVHRSLEPVELAPAGDLVVYRLVQEAITNITKYAKATQVWISLAPRGGVVEVSVRDNGNGFDTDAPSRSAYGLVGMRYRVEAERGTLAVLSAPGRGTLVRVTLPSSTASSG